MKNKKNRTRIICHITTSHPVFSSRIFYKECLSLTNGGYDVNLIAPHEGDEIRFGIKIHAIRKTKGRITRLAVLPWVALLKAVHIRPRPRIFHFHDPELIPIGFLLALIGKHVIYDVHEDIPKQILSKNLLLPRRITGTIGRILGWLEKITCLFFDAMITVNEDISKRLGERKSFIVRNFPLLRQFPVMHSKKKDSCAPVIIYAGGLTSARGTLDLVRAMADVQIDSTLILYGEWESEVFRKECEREKGWERVKYKGYVSIEKVYDAIRDASIGISTLHPFPNYLRSLPLKIFEYMACAIPVIASDFPFWHELFGESVIYVDPMNHLEISKCIDMLLKDLHIQKEMGKRGRKLVETEYNWEKESKKLLKTYESVWRDK